MGVIRTYRDLLVWQKGMMLARRIYHATKSMPSEERFGLTSQMRRSAVSIPSNIAEGYGRQSTFDYLRFMRIARGSLAELSTQYELAVDMQMMPEDPDTPDLLKELDRMLQSLILKLEAKQREKQDSAPRTNRRPPQSP